MLKLSFYDLEVVGWWIAFRESDSLRAERDRSKWKDSWATEAQGGELSWVISQT